MGERLIIDKPFDILDAEIWQYLKHQHDLDLDFIRRSEVEGAFVYYMSHWHYGKIELRKVDISTCELTISDPDPDEFDTMTPQELADQPRAYSDGTPIPAYSDEVRLKMVRLYTEAIENRAVRRGCHTRIINNLLEVITKLPANQKDSGHYSYDAKKRKEIVEDFRNNRHKYSSQEAFAKKWAISEKTLRSYIREFSKTET